jgi:PadR family transcriptional regulator PadR
VNIGDWRFQIKRGALEFCVLTAIARRPSYGHEIISIMDKYPILAAKENTIYPLLRRMLKDGYISSVWLDGVEGLPPRKYYSIMGAGREYLEAMAAEWMALQSELEDIIGGQYGQDAE